MFGVIVLSFVSIALAVIVVLCARGRIRRNPLVGLRVPSLFASDEAWMAGHHAAAPPIVVAAIACSLVGAVGIVFRPVIIAAAPVMALILLVALVVGVVLASKAARASGTEL